MSDQAAVVMQGHDAGGEGGGEAWRQRLAEDTLMSEEPSRLGEPFMYGVILGVLAVVISAELLCKRRWQ